MYVAGRLRFTSGSSRVAAGSKSCSYRNEYRLEVALALYMIVAWRVLYLIMLGRTLPELSCEAVLGSEEWKAVYLVTQRKKPPSQPPALQEMLVLIATLGGFLARKGDGPPGPKALWIGLQRTRDFVLALQAREAVS